MFTTHTLGFHEGRANEGEPARKKSVFYQLLKLASAKPHPLDTVAMV